MRCLSISVSSRLDWLENRQGEYNLWDAGLKATHVGRSSLDHRVRDMPELREIICDLLDGLAESLENYLQTAESKSESSSPEAELGSSLEVQDADSIFSDFSSEGSESYSMPSIGESGGPLSESYFNIKTILEQLTRVATAIRRSGAKHRYRKADALLKEQDFEDFKKHLTFVVLMRTVHLNAEKSAAEYSTISQGFGLELLSVVQKRLIHANVVRRNRIILATRSMGPIETQDAEQIQQQGLLEMAKLPLSEVKPAIRIALKPTQTVSDELIAPLQAPSINAPSTIESATEIGSQFNLQAAVSNQKTPSVVTRITRIGATQDYPSCPTPILGGILRCPYCADLLPVEYSSNSSRWRGHVAQDILPYSCIYEGCKTPDIMYLTSDELLNHMHGQHSVIRWVCDYCSSKHYQPYIFESFEQWETHMYKMHRTALLSSQLSSLSEVSQRRMLEVLCCPLCAYTTDISVSNVDHIAEHLHAFALRCLPWATGGIDRDSGKTKLAEGSSSNLITDEDAGDEMPPVERFHQPSFQQGFAEARQIMADVTELLTVSSLRHEPDPTVERLHKEAKVLSRFQCSVIRKIGFVGDSGVGKSSIISSILDVKSLVRTSNSGAACTCIITEYHYNNRDNFVIEIELFSVDEVMEQITQLLQAYRHYHFHGAEMSQDQKKYFEERAKIAQDTFRAMFRGRLDGEQFLIDQPEDSVLVTLRSWTQDIGLSAIDRREVRSTLADCSALLMRFTLDQASSQEPAIWPYVRKIKVFLKVPALSKGLVLVDLPGLRDLNSARQNITERYLLQCDKIFAVCCIGRATTDAGLMNVFELARQAMLSNVAIICTKSDDIRAEEAKNDWKGQRAKDIQHLIDVVTKSQEDFNEVETQLAEYDDDVLSEGGDDPKQVQDLYRRSRKAMKLIADHQYKLKEYLVNTRNTSVRVELHGLYGSRVPDGRLEVFCVSNTDYWEHRDQSKGTASPLLELSGIIELRRHCVSLLEDGQLRIAMKYIRDDIPDILSEIALWVQSGAERVNTERKETVRETLDALEARLRRDLNGNFSQVNSIARSMMEEFHTQLYKRQHIHDWSKGAIEAGLEWSTFHHLTYAAFCRHYGHHATAMVGRLNWNEKAIEGMIRDLTSPWQRLRTTLHNRHRSITRSIEDLMDLAIQYLDTELQDFPDLTAILSQVLTSRQHLLLWDVEEVCKTFEDNLSALRTDALSGIRTSFIGRAMENSYYTCNLESGVGSDGRRKRIINDKLKKESLFEDLMEKFRERFIHLANNLQSSIEAAIETHLDIVQRTLDIIKSENVVSESQQDPDFRGHVGAKIKTAREKIRQIQAAVDT